MHVAVYVSQHTYHLGPRHVRVQVAVLSYFINHQKIVSLFIGSRVRDNY